MGKKMALMTVGFVLIAILSFFLTKENNENTFSSDISHNKFETNQSNKIESPKNVPPMKTDLSLAGLDLGINVQQMHNILGKELSQKTEGEYQIFNYDLLQVGVKNEIVDALISNSTLAKTKRNLHQGADLQEIIEQYGNNYLKSMYEHLLLYEYKFEDSLSRQGILRFAINSSTNKIEYISVRTLDESMEKSVQQKKESTEDRVKQTLKNYYKYITEKNFHEAYEILSWDMQNIMGTYENFSHGYDETISSTAKNLNIISNIENEFVIEYDLIARDKFQKNRIKVQTFKGTATLILIDEDWHIDNMRVKKMDEYIE